MKNKALWTRLPNQKMNVARPMVKKHLRQRSVRMTRLMASYRKQKVEFLANRMCAVFPSRKAVEVHHIRGRAGTLLLNKKFWLPVSREGHHHIHSEPRLARLLGFLCQPGEWNKPE